MSKSAESSSVNKLLPIIAVVIILGGLLLGVLGLFTVSSYTMISGGSASGSAGTLQYMTIDNRWLTLMRDPAGKPRAVAIGLDSTLVSPNLSELHVVHDDGSSELLALPGTDFLRIVDDLGVTVVANPLTDDQLADIIGEILDGTRDIEAMIKRW
jgi:hypothetical protein